MYLGVAARLGETRVALCDRGGHVIQEWDQLDSLGVDLSTVETAICYTLERQQDLQEWAAQLHSVWLTSWPDAALAGAFSGQPGVRRAPNTGPCTQAAPAKTGPSRFARPWPWSARPITALWPSPMEKGGWEWLSREALRLLEEVSGPSQHRLQHSLGAFRGELNEMAPMRERARAVRHQSGGLGRLPWPRPGQFGGAGQSRASSQ